jgi:hypothetical protein
LIITSAYAFGKEYLERLKNEDAQSHRHSPNFFQLLDGIFSARRHEADLQCQQSRQTAAPATWNKRVFWRLILVQAGLIVSLSSARNGCSFC